MLAWGLAKLGGGQQRAPALNVLWSTAYLDLAVQKLPQMHAKDLARLAWSVATLRLAPTEAAGARFVQLCTSHMVARAGAMGCEVDWGAEEASGGAAGAEGQQARLAARGRMSRGRSRRGRLNRTKKAGISEGARSVCKQLTQAQLHMVMWRSAHLHACKVHAAKLRLRRASRRQRSLLNVV